MSKRNAPSVRLRPSFGRLGGFDLQGGTADLERAGGVVCAMGEQFECSRRALNALHSSAGDHIGWQVLEEAEADALGHEMERGGRSLGSSGGGTRAAGKMPYVPSSRSSSMRPASSVRQVSVRRADSRNRPMRGWSVLSQGEYRRHQKCRSARGRTVYRRRSLGRRTVSTSALILIRLWPHLCVF